jgi:hypothetical protein
VVRGSGRVDQFTPSSHFYLFPLKAGNTWDLKSTQVTTDPGSTKERIFDMTVHLTVFGEEEIEVPAGRMRAVKVEREVQWKQRGTNDAGQRKTTFWYNGAAKRWVRMADKSTTSAGKVILEELSELASYNVK